MSLSHDDVREILRLIDESDLDELLIEADGFTLHVSKSGAPAAGVSPRPAVLPRAEREETPPPAAAHRPDSETIASPMLGTFYRAESPGAEPFVQVGSEVTAETTVCIIEVMKMMNSVPAGVSGVISEIVAENAQLVEYGEPLFLVRVGGVN
ncbi:MAG: acetyl-CoA carboxylase biotin carboxyl carrier protein [Solirubrobacteraceae bacterium]